MLNLYEKEQMLGYMIMAAKDMKLEKKAVKELVDRTIELSNMFTEVVAEEEYDKFLRRA